MKKIVVYIYQCFFLVFLQFVVSSVLAACAAQQVDPKDAKILKEQRFNSGDGRNGAAFATENGQIFREETDIDGNRIGQYSYIGDDGRTYTVRYSAGKDGFRILEGDHIRATGQDAAQFSAEEAAPIAASLPVSRPAVQPVEQPAVRVVSQPRPVSDFDYEDTPVDPNFNPFINPHDPTHRNFQFNQNAAQFDPAAPTVRQQSLVPNCADCAGVNPFINPFDASHQAGGQLAGHLAGFGAGQQQQVAPRRPVARPAPVVPQPIQRVATLTTTPSPSRSFPLGQLTLNRFETGFNFDFES